MKCKHAHGKVIVTCAFCGIQKPRKRSKVKEVNFCGSVCMHAYNRGGVIVNEDLYRQIIEDLNSGFTWRQLEGLYNISQTVIKAAKTWALK